MLVTHGVTYLPEMDSIIVLRGCTISERGSFDTLLQSKGAFADFLSTYMHEENGEDTQTEDEDIAIDTEGFSICCLVTLERIMQLIIVCCWR